MTPLCSAKPIRPRLQLARRREGLHVWFCVEGSSADADKTARKASRRSA
jgi:hypothetical protein